MARLGQEDVVPATREVLRRVASFYDVPTTVLQKELAKWNNVALNQLRDVLDAVAEDLGT